MAHAAQTPELLGELVNQDGFGFIGRLMFSAEIGAKGVQFGGIFMRKDKLGRIEAVLEGIPGGVFLSRGRARTR